MSAPLTASRVIAGRYEIKGSPLGQGGMGEVYNAYDTVTKRTVALKTLRGAAEPTALELFAKEWKVLAQLSHPNIVDVLDTGEYEEAGQKKPFFVMPLLPGMTLDSLIRKASPRLTAARVVEIIAQTAKGLQAAHEKGLVHRDLKPSNIFVMDDDTVKIIDFGVVHLSGAQSIAGLKGTLPYMAPEQVDMKPATAASDIFSLGVVCYETLTGRKPFARESEMETIKALLHFIPPPASEINSSVSPLLGRVVHKAMAKQPSYRFSSARDFAETLQKALRNEPIEAFDRNKIGPRIERVKKACQERDYQFASEILTGLEVEGHIDPDMNILRVQIDEALRQKSIRQLLDIARSRMEEEEFSLALEKIQELRELDPENAEARNLLGQMEQRRSERQVEKWFELVHRHMDTHMYAQARQGLEEILKINPSDTKARELMAEADRREQEFVAQRNQKEQLYQAAMQAYQGGEISSALSKLERILQLERTLPGSESPEREAQYQSFYNQVRSERDLYRNGYSEARRHMTDRNFAAALEICANFLKQYPGDALFQALKLELEEQQRQEQSAFVAEMNRRVDAEADLDRKYAILAEAAERFPTEQHFHQSLRLIRERRDLVNGIVGKARQHEERGQYADALGQWEILRSIYGQYPGLEFELQRLSRRRQERAREETKARWVEQIDQRLEAGDYARAQDLARNALEEFPDDRELAGLERLAAQGIERSSEAQQWLAEGQRLCTERHFSEGLEALKKAEERDGKNPVIRQALLIALLEQARSVLAQNWRTADPLIQHALDLDPNHPVAKNLRGLVDDYKNQELIEELVCDARELQAAGDIETALGKVEEGLATHPNDPRLTQLRNTLRNALPEPRRREMREQYLRELKALVGVIDQAASAEQTAVLVEQSRTLVERYPDDGEFRTIAAGIESKLQAAGKVPGTLVSASSVPPAAPAQAAAPTQAAASAPTVGRAPEQQAPQAATRQSSRPPLMAAAGTWSVRAVERVAASLQKASEFGRNGSPLQWTVVAGAAVLLISAYLVTKSSQKTVQAPPPAVQEYAVELRANAPRVLYFVDGAPVNGPIKLGKGLHHAEASAEGFKSETKDFTLGDGSSSPLRLEFQLAPEPVRLQLASDLTTGKVAIDNQEPAALQDGNFARDDLAAGEHILKLLADNREVMSIDFKADPGEPAVLTRPVEAHDVSAVVVSSLGDRARVYATGAAKAVHADQPPALLPPEGLVLNGLNPGSAAVQIDDGKNLRPFPIELGNLPHLNLWVNSDRNIGFLTVEANVPDAQVFLDGKPTKRPNLRAGKITLSLEPKAYKVRVAAPGYEDVAEQAVEVHKGEPKGVKFELKAAVTTAGLQIEGGTPEAEVWFDGARSGSLNAAGSWSLENIAPGMHTIQLRKTEFEDLTANRTFTAKQTVRLAGEEARLRPLGKLEFRVSPANARLTYRLQDEAAPHQARNNQPVAVKAGSYEVQAQAEGLTPQTRQYQVSPGQTAIVELTLTAPAAPKKIEVTETPRRVESPFEAGMWKTLPDGWASRTGPGYSWLSLNRGTFDVEIRKQVGKAHLVGPKRMKRVEWVIDYKDEANHINYSLDQQNFTRKEIVSGKGMAENKGPSHVDPAADEVRIRIEVQPSRITVKDAAGTELDVLSRENATAELGKFGFRGDVEVKATAR
jgi:serine/threonine protein kinase/cytochrome c-type biogenesis protein CcmH/NrfG